MWIAATTASYAGASSGSVQSSEPGEESGSHRYPLVGGTATHDTPDRKLTDVRKGRAPAGVRTNSTAVPTGVTMAGGRNP